MNQSKQRAIVYAGAVVLLLYPLRHAFTGLDIMDAGYSLGNYQYFDSMNQTWKFATYLSNVLGRILTNFPYGGTWAGINVYTSLLIGITATGVFCFFVQQHKQEQNAWWEKYILFVAEFTAVSLCWAPSVILYQYLGYYLMTAAVLLLYQAITKDRPKNFIIAGVILGLCVAVRMPNITYMALILPVWYSCFQSDTNTRWQMLIRRTALCIAGYLAGALTPILYISARYGVWAYPEMLQGLFGMTDTATDYKPVSMITAMFSDYSSNSVWLVLFLAYMAAGFAAFTLLRKVFGHKSLRAEDPTALKWGQTCIVETLHAYPIAYVGSFVIVFGFYILGLLLLLRLCYGRGMFDFDYTAYFSMYKWVTVYLLTVIGLCIWCLVRRNISEQLKLWAVFLLVIIWITPLGSNNGLYPIINNLFLVAPVSAFMIIEAFRQLKGIADSFVFRLVWSVFLICAVLQSILFGIFFVFHDKQPIDAKAGEGRQKVYLQSSNKLNGLKTTIEKKEQLEALDQFLVKNQLTDKQLIVYGDIPALAYIFDMEPAVFTTWPDLDSNPLERLQQDLLSINGDMPVVIFGVEAVDRINEQSGVRYKKLSVIQEFLLEGQYREVYKSDKFQVFYPIYE